MFAAHEPVEGADHDFRPGKLLGTNTSCNDGECIHIIHLENFLAKHVAALNKYYGAGKYQIVHIGRDPVAVVFSSYLYHMDTSDCAQLNLALNL